MMTIFEILFWISLLSIIYAFIGYPIVLWAMGLFASKPIRTVGGGPLQSVSVVISAYNEAGIIEKKIINALELDYPKEKLEIAVVSDASTDETDKIAEGYQDKGVRLVRQGQRKGKTAALNLAIPMLSGEIVVFSDANSLYAPSAIKSLVRSFQDPTLGFVTGRTIYRTRTDLGTGESTGFYSRLEMITKKLESRIGSCVGADGAIFAIRKELYAPLADEDINDFVIPLRINKAGYRGILEPAALCIEETAASSSGEFSRQVRVTARTLRAISNNMELLNPFRYPLFSFMLTSHKLFKFGIPFFLFTLLSSNFFLIGTDTIYSFTLVAQLGFYSAVFWRHSKPQRNSVNRLADFTYTFVMVSFAMLVGWIKFLSGETYNTWSPQRK